MWIESLEKAVQKLNDVSHSQSHLVLWSQWCGLLSVTFNCVSDNKCFWQKPYLQGCVLFSKDSGVGKSLIMLWTVLFIKLLWETLLILMVYPTHMRILNIYPHLSRFLSQIVSRPFSQQRHSLAKCVQCAWWIRIVPTSQGYSGLMIAVCKVPVCINFLSGHAKMITPKYIPYKSPVEFMLIIFQSLICSIFYNSRIRKKKFNHPCPCIFSLGYTFWNKSQVQY